MAATAIRAPLSRLLVGRLDDARLAELAATGDERAFEVVYDRHHRALLGFCRHMLGSKEEGEDALQQTFLRAHRSLLSQGAPDELRPWLYAIARNRCLTMLAARKAAAVPVDDLEPSTDGLSAGVEERADLRALLGDIARLPDDQRSALVLAELGDLSHAEIARVIDVPAAKVKALVHQARTRLIADRDARETPCEDVRELLATASGGELRRGPLRRHLAMCDGCRAYKDAIHEQRGALALVLPVVPSVGLKDTIFGALGGGGGGAAAAAGGSAATGGAVAATGGGLFSGGATGLGAKLAIGAALIGSAGGGAVVVDQVAQPPEKPVARSGQAAAEPAATTGTPAAGGARGSTGAVLIDGAGEEASATGREHRDAAAERRAERARERAADKRQREREREQAKQDRETDKLARVLDRERRKRDRAAAKEQRTAERADRIAAKPERGTSGAKDPNGTTNRSTSGSSGSNGPDERSTTTGPRTQKPAAVLEPKPVATPKPVPTKSKSETARGIVEEIVP